MPYSYLALGDSYTIGEGLPIRENFPYQTVQLLRAAGHAFYAPEIIARTGWTTDELDEALTVSRLLPAYDLVSLLIGVNNEYRGRSLAEYEAQFRVLLEKAICYTGRSSHAPVFVLSIPDWSVSPFAGTYLPDRAGRDKMAVAAEIDAFNAAARRITEERGIEFIDITQHSRKPDIVAITEALPGSGTPGLFVADGLHPSGNVYRYWAERLAERVRQRLT